MPLPIVFTLLSIAVMMDVFDGYIARRTNSQSEFGALFDMEVDAFYVLAMGIYFCFTTDFGLWLLIPGGIRYVYDLVRIGFGDEQFVPRRQPLAVFLAGVNFVLLLLALMLPRDLSLLVLLISLCVVSFSFGRSFFDLFRYGLRQNGLR
jgi:phosphatidylglycerophosphate synthase